MTDRDLDLVLLGATGFVGRLTARHLAEHAPAGTRIALAGRSPDRLRAVRDTLGPVAVDWPLLTVDSSDRPALDGLARRATAVATTVGPYARHGLPLAGACAAAGTHYADLTGEVQFVRRVADAHHSEAVGSGARVVHACGFDSVPSDLGVLLTARAAQADGAGSLGDTTLLVTDIRGGVSGGTIDSMRGLVDEVRRDRGTRRLVRDVHALSPDRAAEPDVGPRDAVGPVHDPVTGRWAAPFVMGIYNTRIVRRSNALTDWSYGRGMRYQELLATGPAAVAPVAAAAVSAGLGALVAGMAFPPTRVLLDRLLPSPGEGPSERTMRDGRFTVEIHARTTTGARYVTTVSAQGDPGYAATALMLGEAALALALDGDRLPSAAGVLTPATALGEPYVERLRAAGMTLETRRLSA